MVAQKPIIGLNTAAGPRWRLKSLSPEKTAELADLLANRYHAQLLLFGGPDETERNNSIIELSKVTIINSGGSNSLRQFAALIRLCDILITSDSLAMHMAYSLGVKLVAFFGPTSASEIELFGHGKKITSTLDCICCYKPNCDFSPNCMATIPFSDITDSIDQYLPTLSKRSIPSRTYV